MERETKTIKTPTGIVVELKTYITGREKQSIDIALYGDMKATGDGTGKMEVSLKSVIEQDNATIKAVVVNIDGSPDNVFDKVLDMKTQDFDFVLREAKQVVAGLEIEKKTE